VELFRWRHAREGGDPSFFFFIPEKNHRHPGLKTPSSRNPRVIPETRFSALSGIQWKNPE